MKTVLVVGGAGYIGSHMVKMLLARGCQVITLDNLSTGHRDAVMGGEFIHADLADRAALDAVLRTRAIDGVMHFASCIEVAESMRDPGKYYRNNVANTLNLLDAMVDNHVNCLIFSSTAAIFGEPTHTPIAESHAKQPINPYGRSKWMLEQILRDYDVAHGLRAIALRYFNAAGADPDGQLGERHQPESHLIPLVLQAVSGQRPHITVFGRDYATPDGTCIRDYIHVEDLCAAHWLALTQLWQGAPSAAYNLGNGNGFSVQQVIDTARAVTGLPLCVQEGARRPGDPAVLTADATQARQQLGWQPQWTELSSIISHAWQWEQKVMSGQRKIHHSPRITDNPPYKLAEKNPWQAAPMPLATTPCVNPPEPQAKRSFLAVANHQLRSLLNAILGGVEMLQAEIHGPLSAGQAKNMARIAQSGRQLLAALDGIVDIVRMDAGHFQLCVEWFAPQPLAERRLRALQEIAAARHIHLECAVDVAVCWLEGDVAQLELTVAHLLERELALASPGSTVGIRIQGYAAQRTAAIAIGNLDIAMPPAKPEKGMPWCTENELDLDLALMRAQRVIARHGGQLEHYGTDKTQGEHLVIWLPWRVNETQDSNAPPTATQESTRTRASILLVDDNISNLEIMGEYLQVKGYSVLSATDGATGVQLAENHMPDLILMDIQMPVMDGLEAIHQLRSNSATQHIPIVALTALTMPGDRERCLGAGADDYLGKPVRMQDLQKKIKMYLPLH